ncbi:helix-turn-helix domain-containing protein [Neptuniibacter sp. QD37_11]|uniref:helix-turn-helix domain-containing protein n=1 Tax=Neptuniibacter sp. QD37_11 TaxID=3398209 RepID=UPI0039F57A1E
MKLLQNKNTKMVIVEPEVDYKQYPNLKSATEIRACINLNTLYKQLKVSSQHMDQEIFAGCCGMSQGYMSKLLKGQNPISPKTALKLSEGLGCESYHIRPDTITESGISDLLKAQDLLNDVAEILAAKDLSSEEMEMLERCDELLLSRRFKVA